MAIVQASVKTIEIHCAIGAQDYFTEQYTALGYFNHTTEVEVNLQGQVEASVTPIEHNLVIGQETYFVDQYVSLGYTRHTFEANRFEIGAADLNISTSIGEQQYFDTQDYVLPGYFRSSTPAFITTNVDADASIPITMVIGTQDYLAADDYLPQNFFQNTFDANVETVASEAILSSTATVTASATVFDNAAVSISSELFVGDQYVELGYIEQGYFAQATTPNVIASAEVDSSIAGTVTMTANADFVADIIISSSLSIVTIAGSEKDGQANLSATASVSCDPDEIQAGVVQANIAASTNITAGANRTASVSANIAARSNVVASAIPTAISIFGGALTTSIVAGVIRDNPRYTLLIPQESRVNTITQETRQVIIPEETRELEFEV